jgi:2C-methyl-D-erythritol 2,4-cyclodiphosphate synthase
MSALSWLPYIVYSRRSGELLRNLYMDDHPVLFEGIHSCYFISHRLLRKRIKIYRESNIDISIIIIFPKLRKTCSKRSFSSFPD